MKPDKITIPVELDFSLDHDPTSAEIYWAQLILEKHAEKMARWNSDSEDNE